MVSVSVRYFFYQPMDEKIKTWPLGFPAKEPTKSHARLYLFDKPIKSLYFRSFFMIERFSYILEMKTREQNRKNERK